MTNLNLTILMNLVGIAKNPGQTVKDCYRLVNKKKAKEAEKL